MFPFSVLVFPFSIPVFSLLECFFCIVDFTRLPSASLEATPPPIAIHHSFHLDLELTIVSNGNSCGSLSKLTLYYLSLLWQ